MKNSIVKKVESRDYLFCMNHPARIVETSYGFIEYADRGVGPVILSVHGGPGGFDQGLGMAEVFRKNGYRIIAVSRPGYLNTPPLHEETPEAQAKLLVSLLDALHLDQVILLNASAGGPSAYMLAQNYPDRVKALISIDSVCTTYTKLDTISPFEEWFYMSNAGMLLIRFFIRFLPKLMIKSFLQTESSLTTSEINKQTRIILRDKAQLQFIKLMLATMTQNFRQRKQGLNTDKNILNNIAGLKLNGITCPALIIHGTHDSDVEPAQAEYAAASISGARLLWIEKGSHIGFWVGEHAKNAQERTLEWVSSFDDTIEK